MDLKNSTLKPIGIVHSPYKLKSEAPHQGDETISEIEIFPEFVEGLKDISGFSHLHIIYYLHQSESYSLMVITPWDEEQHGLFATRSPNRVNPIGYAVVELIKRDKNILTVKYLDAIDGTPVLDIKPYVPEIDIKKVKKTGWLGKKYGNLQPRIYEFESNLKFVAGKELILSSQNKPNIIAGCAPEFGGKKEFWSPQHLFVASIELCLATTFLWLLEKENLIIAAYRSHAVGKAHLKNKDFVFSEILIKPIITICEKNIKEKILNLIQEAGQECMISKSIICPILIEPEIEISD